MSWQTTAWVRAQSEGLDAHAKWVLMLMSDHADETGRCWPSLAKLTEDSLLARSTVHRLLNRLVELNYLHRLGLRRAGGVMEYRLNMERSRASTPSHGGTGFIHTPSHGETGTPSHGETPPVLSGETRITKNHQESPARTDLSIEDRLRLDLGRLE